MCLCPGSRFDPPALPDSSPAPRSDAKHSFLPRNCSAAWPGSDARQPEPLASHALLHGVRSCTSSPELPPVAYEIDAVAPTLFGCCQRRWSVGSGGAENTNWRTQVFRAILERQCVLESERGSACLTRETRKQRGVVGVRLGPPHSHQHTLHRSITCSLPTMHRRFLSLFISLSQSSTPRPVSSGSRLRF